MFKSLRIKLITTIMGVLSILFIGILLAIYLISYQRSMDNSILFLKKICRINGFEILKENHSNIKNIDVDSYYLVQIGDNNEIIKISNNSSSGYTKKELGKLAVTLSEKEEDSGKIGDLSYCKRMRRRGTFISFYNNSLQNSYYKALFYTNLVIGCIGLILLFIITLWLSRWMIKPVENAFQNQKQFISNAGHELKTPIAIISSNTDALERELGESKWLDYIRTETSSLNKLVSDLLQLATLDSYEDRNTFQKINFSKLVMSIALPFESVAFEKQIHLNEEIDDSIYITGDAAKLGQLITIFIDNAMNYTESGGNILVKLIKHHDKRILTVTNTSKEIPLSERELIFDRFYRVDEARSRENGNYGLGLSIAKSITRLHNGKISVSCKNNLTTFKVVF